MMVAAVRAVSVRDVVRKIYLDYALIMRAKLRPAALVAKGRRVVMIAVAELVEHVVKARPAIAAANVLTLPVLA